MTSCQHVKQSRKSRNENKRERTNKFNRSARQNDDDDDDEKLLQNINTFQLGIYSICYCFSAPINYSRHRTVSIESKYSTEFQGSFGPPAPSAK